MADRSRSLKEFFSSPKPNRTNTLPASNSSTWYSSKNRNSGQKCLKRGWLRRQSFGIVKTWQSRWFVLYEDNLSYYSTDDETKSIVGQIYLRGRAVSEHASNANESSQKFVFEISPGDLLKLFKSLVFFNIFFLYQPKNPEGTRVKNPSNRRLC